MHLHFLLLRSQVRFPQGHHLHLQLVRVCVRQKVVVSQSSGQAQLQGLSSGAQLLPVVLSTELAAFVTLLRVLLVAVAALRVVLVALLTAFAVVLATLPVAFATLLPTLFTVSTTRSTALPWLTTGCADPASKTTTKSAGSLRLKVMPRAPL